MAKTGILLLNLGTPNSPEPKDVGRYLKQFLMDPLVIDIPAPLRWFLVNVLIVPKRSHSSSEAYKKIWTERGSPLLFNHLDLAERVSSILGEAFAVVPGMRYGEPSIPSALAKLKRAGVDGLHVVPLYPQFSLAATQSSIDETERALRELGWSIRPGYFPAFYDRPEFIDSFREVIRRELDAHAWDHLLFSFHGLPERQVKRTDRSPGQTHCFASETCCDRITESNRDCYRAQCFSTARDLARTLGIESGRHSVSFQSRLGATPWIKPYTDEVFPKLVESGVRRLAVACPAFVADCLETLEEITLRGREAFIAAGGEDLFLIPSLNSEPVWAENLSKAIVSQAIT